MSLGLTGLVALVVNYCSEVLRRRPDDIREFAASKRELECNYYCRYTSVGYFCDPTLPEGITKQLEERFSNRT